MEQTPNTAAGRGPARRPFQYPLQMLFWMMVNVGMASAYLRKFGVEAVALGVLVIGLAILVGLAVGRPFRRTGDSVYWAVLGALLAYSSAVTVAPLDRAWAAVGAASGAAVGTAACGRPVRTFSIGAMVGWSTFLVCVGFLRPHTGAELTFDIACSFAVGGLYGVLVEVFGWLEKKAKLPRFITASVLLFAVILGNILALRMLRR